MFPYMNVTRRQPLRQTRNRIARRGLTASATECAVSLGLPADPSGGSRPAGEAWEDQMDTQDKATGRPWSIAHNGQIDGIELFHEGRLVAKHLHPMDAGRMVNGLNERDALLARVSELEAARAALYRMLFYVQEWADEQKIAIPVRCGVRAALARGGDGKVTP